MNRWLSHPSRGLARPTGLTAWLTWIALVLAAWPLLTGCVTTRQTEDWLAQSGFRALPADNPQRLQALNALPERKVSRAEHHGKTFYVYPDKQHRLLYVGNPSAHTTYRNLLATKTAAAEAQATLLVSDPSYVLSQDLINCYGPLWPLE